MELTFVESNALGKVKAWECEFEVTADFNLHIEREKGGRILFYQKSQGAGGWAHIDDMGWQDGKPSIDYDFTALVYPKMIKIVSESEPTFAAVVTDGEVTEIKSQSKEIEVTANGTTVVEPDAGFAYLNKVSVKTNVEGQGGGGSSDKDGWVYFDLRNSEHRQDFLFIAQFCPVFLCGLMEYGGVVQCGVTINAYEQNNSGEQLVNNLYGMAMYLGGMIKVGDIKLTNEEYINTIASQLGITNPIDKAPRITEEEFYNLNA